MGKQLKGGREGWLMAVNPIKVILSNVVHRSVGCRGDGVASLCSTVGGRGRGGVT